MWGTIGRGGTDQRIRSAERAQPVCLIPDDTRFEYPAVLTSFSCKATGVEPYYLVTASFAVVRRLPLREVIFHSGGTLSGSFSTPETRNRGCDWRSLPGRTSAPYTLRES